VPSGGPQDQTEAECQPRLDAAGHFDRHGTLIECNPSGLPHHDGGRCVVGAADVGSTRTKGVTRERLAKSVTIFLYSRIRLLLKLPLLPEEQCQRVLS
jgi:hypothetical protein